MKILWKLFTKFVNSSERGIRVPGSEEEVFLCGRNSKNTYLSDIQLLNHVNTLLSYLSIIQV